MHNLCCKYYVSTMCGVCVKEYYLIWPMVYLNIIIKHNSYYNILSPIILKNVLISNWLFCGDRVYANIVVQIEHDLYMYVHMEPGLYNMYVQIEPGL
jgi:hypothetical protein